MDPVTVVCSVITIYQLTCKIAELAFDYAQSARSANKESDYIIDEIVNFQRSLRVLKCMLTDEEVNVGKNRLESLKELIEGDNTSLNRCETDLKNVLKTLENGRTKERIKSVLHRLSWPFKEEEVRKITDRLRLFAASVDRALAMDSAEMIRDTQSITKQMANSLKSAEVKHEKRQIDKDQKEIKKQIMKWLLHPDPVESHNAACHARNRNVQSGRWFLDGNYFKIFRETPRSLLFLHGNSGCGMTVLCSTIIEELKALSSANTQILAFWYYHKNEKQRTSLNNLVRALISQIVLSSSGVPPVLVDFWRLKKQETPKTSDLVQILQNILIENTNRDIYVVIDALDESEETERDELMEIIRKILLSDTLGIRILVTGRTNTAQIEHEFPDEVLKRVYKVTVAPIYVNPEILAHVTERLQNDKILKTWPEKERNKAKDILVKKAGGMFRWVDCQLQALRKCKTPAEVEKTLTTLPKDLYEQYERELATTSNSQIALKILWCLTYPQRRLQMEEITDIIAVDLDRDPPFFDEQNKMWNPEAVLEICGSLVRVDVVSRRKLLDKNLTTAQMLTTAHASVLEFLRTKMIRVGSEPEIRFTRSFVNLRMAETCLVYLRYLVDNNIELTENNLRKYPFARYCANFWVDHYRESFAHGEEEADTTRLNALVMDLFKTPDVLLQGVRLYDPESDWPIVNIRKQPAEIKSPLYYAASLGLSEIAQNLIDQGAKVNDSCGNGFGRPLLAAIALGRADTVSFLLDKGADPNLIGCGDLGCPLAAAVEKNEPEIVRIFLRRKDIDINCRRIPFPSMQEFIENKSDRTLSKHYSPASIESISRQSMVYIAAAYNAPEVLRILLDEGADPNIEGGAYHTALQAACARGLEGIVESLLEKGSKVNMYGGFYGSALIAACYSGSCAIVAKLIEKGSDINYVGGDKSVAALHAACAAEDDYIQSQLKDDEIQSVLYAACPQGKKNLMQMLLENGANPNLECEGDDYNAHWFRTPLQTSVTISTTTLLLDYGAAINTQSGYYGTALHSAVFPGKEPGLAAYLIIRGADVNISHWNHGTPFALACALGNWEKGKLLLENGALLNQYDMFGRSPLQIAISNSRWDVFDRLMELGDDPLHVDKRRCATLHYAAGKGNDDVVRRILKSQPDIGYVDSNGWSALHWAAASSCGTSRIVKTLLQAGIDENLKDKQGRMALNLAKSFMKYDEIAVLSTEKTALSDFADVKDRQRPNQSGVQCDGCKDNRSDYGPDCMYHCKICFNFDLCFRCIEDKDIVHHQGHEFMTGYSYPASHGQKV